MKQRACQPTGQPGFSLVELIIAMLISMIIMTAAVSLLFVFQRTTEQQRAAREIQTQAHRSAEHLIRIVRNADQIDGNSTTNSLVVTGGLTEALCGNITCWIEPTENGRLIARPPETQAGRETEIAKAVSRFELTYGFDNDQTGQTKHFSPNIQSGQPENVLAVRMTISFEAREGRGYFAQTILTHAVLRTKTLDRLEL